MNGDSYIKSTGFFKSSNGISDIKYYIYTPKVKPIAAMQIVHGMCEFVERYEEFIEFLCQNGIAVFGNDHIGHGSSVKTNDDLGYFFTPSGWNDMIADTRKMLLLGKERFCELPIIMFGHSMGSFVTRACMVKFPKLIDCVILSGTGSGIPAATASLALVESLIKVKGERYRSDTIWNIAFGKFNSHISMPRTQSDWLTRDKDKVREFISDIKCVTIFTLNGMLNLTKLMTYVNQDRWYENVDKEIPVLMMSGTEDPVGDWGEGVLTVYENLKEKGANVALKLYDDCRHELTNELNRQDVYSDVLTALKKTLEI